MPTNKYFDNFPSQPSPESQLLEDLIIESIQVYGADILYLPRTPLSQQDNIYGEQPGSVFSSSYILDMYLEDVVTRPGGGGEFFAKFGLEIKDLLKVVVARRTFQKHVPLSRPREGDLIYMPQFSNLYEIKFVEEEKEFYPLGRRPPLFYFYELQLELFKFNNERFNTGNPDIDQIAMDYSYTIHLAMNTGGAGIFTKGEVVYQGGAVSNATATAIAKNWDRANKTLDIITIKGEFAISTAVKGNTSGANYILASYDRQNFSNVTEEFVNNKDIETEANNIINFDTNNPFGTP